VYEIVPYRPELKAQVAALQRYLWEGDEATNAAYLEWKYERNPYFETPLIYLAMEEGTVVGMRGMFGSCWEGGARQDRFVVPCADDFVIAPEHRNRGLFGRVMVAAVTDVAARAFRCAFSLSPGAVTLAGSLAGGWRSVMPVLESRRVDPRGLPWRERIGLGLQSTPVAWRWSEKVAGEGGRPGRRPFRRLDRAAERAPGRGIWLSSEPRVEAMASLIRRLGHDGRIRHVRDEPYLTWRFANPLHEYRFLFSGGDRLSGYLVLQAYRLNERRGVNIVDWEAETPAARRDLLLAALDWGRFAQINTWAAALPDGTGDLLGAAQFTPVDRGPLMRQGTRLLVRALGPESRDGGLALAEHPLLDASSWDMRMIYSMAG
jgi:GNAT superfamily N-acetyltransferase